MHRKPQQSGGVLAPILIGVVVLTAFACAGVFFAAWFLVNHVHVDATRTSRGETIRVETPFGSMRVRQQTGPYPKHLGIPVYPGAIQDDRENSAARFEFDSDSMHREFSILVAKYTTEDPAEKVIDYYRGQLPHWIISKTRQRGFQLEYTREGFKRFIVVREEHGLTHIALASAGEPAAN